MYRKLATLFLCLTVLTLGPVMIAQAAPQHILKFAGTYAPDHPGSIAQQAIADEVFEATKGELKIEVFPGGQLGDYTQIYEDVMRGNIDMGWLYITGQYNTALEISSLPYLTTSWEGLKKIFSPGSYFYQAYEKAHADCDVKLLALYVDGFVNMVMVKEPVEPMSPTADHKVKLRIPPTDAFKVTMDSLNWDTVTINWADVYTAMQTGVCDGYIGSSAVLVYYTFRDLTKFYYEMRAYSETLSYVINQDTWAKLSPEHQKAIYDACQRQAAKSIETAANNEKTYQQKMADEYGVKIVIPSQEEIDRLADYIRQNVWPKFEKAYGQDLIQGLLSNL
ncbi:MAG: TRAP transporter substrate-binding protein DctP [Candidatus Adiutrix sp.]|jgi:TRAP-type C4-dicarboxylate transport system substrate-binding protein|nr:TRAP transporter substrate-binding protein DctP [Candidatus Adiutrix sp.]